MPTQVENRDYSTENSSDLQQIYNIVEIFHSVQGEGSKSWNSSRFRKIWQLQFTM